MKNHQRKEAVRAAQAKAKARAAQARARSAKEAVRNQANKGNKWCSAALAAL